MLLPCLMPVWDCLVGKWPQIEIFTYHHRQRWVQGISKEEHWWSKEIYIQIKFPTPCLYFTLYLPIFYPQDPVRCKPNQKLFLSGRREEAQGEDWLSHPFLCSCPGTLQDRGATGINTFHLHTLLSTSPPTIIPIPPRIPSLHPWLASWHISKLTYLQVEILTILQSEITACRHTCKLIYLQADTLANFENIDVNKGT